MQTKSIIAGTGGTFEQQGLNADDPTLVGYMADWCGPCRAMEPLLHEVAREYARRLVVAKLNIDENPRTPPGYGLFGIPTLMLFEDGKVCGLRVGRSSKLELKRMIDNRLRHASKA